MVISILSYIPYVLSKSVLGPLLVSISPFSCWASDDLVLSTGVVPIVLQAQHIPNSPLFLTYMVPYLRTVRGKEHTRGCMYIRSNYTPKCNVRVFESVVVILCITTTCICWSKCAQAVKLACAPFGGQALQYELH